MQVEDGWVTPVKEVNEAAFLGFYPFQSPGNLN